MRLPIIAIAALAFLRIVCGLHFFLEGFAHLRDPEWSSAGFRKAAVGPLADWYRSALPQTGDWSGTLGAVDGRSVDEASKAWQQTVVDSWQRLFEARIKKVPLAADARAAAEKSLETARAELADYAQSLEDDLTDYRLQVARLGVMERKPEAAEIPFERERVAKKKKELGAQAASWMKDAAAIGHKLTAEWDAQLPSDADRGRAGSAAEPTKLWRADRFVSWSLVTIGACLVLGVLTKFNAMGGVFFLLSVIATQPFWAAGAQSTYDQWVEVAALLVIASLPTGGWTGLDYFLKKWCPLSSCCGTSQPSCCTPS
ncbi:MAG: hypothetical protein K8S94_16295 [Planctomycetia bacterium]|nr:hypothetical protein [Planctomycetia bacterium]